MKEKYLKGEKKIDWFHTCLLFLFSKQLLPDILNYFEVSFVFVSHPRLTFQRVLIMAPYSSRSALEDTESTPFDFSQAADVHKLM